MSALPPPTTGAGTAERVRRANLGRMLVADHRDGPLSRAALTSELGLNRSTIGALTAELARLGLVHETAGAADGRIGRPSPTVTASGDVVAIAVNPEVDAVTIAVVGLDRRVSARHRVELDGLIDPPALAALVARTVTDWRAHAGTTASVLGIGIAVPGLVRPAPGVVVHAPHLRWSDQPVADLVAAATGLPVTVGNDASFGAHAEHLFGAARGVGDMLYLNGGASGIGGGIVIGDVLVGGSRGFAGEFGHNPAPVTDAADRRAGAAGALEDEVDQHRLLAALGLRSADDADLRRAIERSTSAGVAAEVARQRRILAVAVANAVNILDPEVVVLGGFLATLTGDDTAEFADAVARRTIAGVGPEIRTAALGDDRLVIGAAEAVFAPLLADPAATVAAGTAATVAVRAAASSATHRDDAPRTI